MGRHTIEELYQWQALPLNVKVNMSKARIRDWVEAFGEDGVYVSFSGGKDSTVLLDLVRQEYPGVTAVFVDTGLEYPEIREFVKTFENVEWLRPKKTFKQVINDYGYPFISKEVSERIYYAQKYLTWYKEQNSIDRPTDRPTDYGLLDLIYERNSPEHQKAKQGNIPDKILHDFIESEKKGTYKIKELFGEARNGQKTAFDYTKWRWLATCPYMISNKCCDAMKKAPAHSYAKRTGRKMMSGQMASESRLRTMQWLRNGCNGFDLKIPVSNPMAFWTDQDVLLYIKLHGLKIASVYGDIVQDYDAMGQIEGQMSLSDLSEEWGLFELERPVLKTTGCKRTGCMFCGYGCHIEKEGEGRFELMKKTHPKQYDYIMRPKEQGGLDYKNVIDWINEHGNLHIRY